MQFGLWGQMDAVLAIPAVGSRREDPPKKSAHRLDEIEDHISRSARVRGSCDLLTTDPVWVLAGGASVHNPKNFVELALFEQLLLRNRVTREIATRQMET